MLTEFIDFVCTIIPSIPLETREKLQNSIDQFKFEEKELNLLMLKPLDTLSQGDIISKVPFVHFDNNGNLKQFNTEAMVISTSCHIDQKQRITLVPVLPLVAFNGNKTDLFNNRIYDYMYISDPVMQEKFVDFEYMNTYSKDLIINGIAENKIQRLASLSQFGYYFFLTKLTIFLMRKEDSITLEERNRGFDF